LLKPQTHKKLLTGLLQNVKQREKNLGK